jgi:FkbM family methyltransferase
MLPRIESPLHRFLLETPILRKLGRRVIKETIVSIGGLRFVVRPSHGDISIVGDCLPPEESWINPNDIVIDVGAHIGCFALLTCQRLGGKGMVVAIEPSADNFRLLQRNIVLNHLESICTPIHAGAGEKEGFAKIRTFKHSASDSFYERNDDSDMIGYEDVRLVTLDDTSGSANFIKINVEGYEYDVLKGASKLIKKSHPKIFFQYHKFAPITLDALLSYLGALGYEAHYDQSKDMYLASYKNARSDA